MQFGSPWKGKGCRLCWQMIQPVHAVTLANGVLCHAVYPVVQTAQERIAKEREEVVPAIQATCCP
jgi:hypothetical protein